MLSTAVCSFLLIKDVGERINWWRQFPLHSELLLIIYFLQTWGRVLNLTLSQSIVSF